MKSANAVARLDNLEFLSDIVPRTVPYKQVKEKKVPQAPQLANGEGSMEAGQTTLLNGANGFAHEAAGEDGEDAAAADPNAQLEMEIRGARAEAIATNGEEAPADVEMGENGA